VPERPYPEHDLGKRESRFRVVERDAIAARQGELQAAAHAEPVDHGGRGEGEVTHLLRQIPAQARELERLVRRLELHELVHIGAGDEVFLA